LLREIRQEAGFTQAALAAKIHRGQTFISKSELGERRIDFLETVDFCAGCGVGVEDLLERLEQTIRDSTTVLNRGMSASLNTRCKPLLAPRSK
jgi:transcriptional regulator with XRE-family HTH domain